MTARRYPTERLHDPGSDRAQCSAPLPLPPLWVVETTKTWTGWPAACRPPAAVPSWCRHCAGRRRHCRRRGEAAGGGREARGIPGRGEEDEYRGRKVQGGVDKAHCRWEEEEGKSIGGRAWDRVPGAGGKLISGGRRQRPGTGRPHCRCPSVALQRGGISSRPPSFSSWWKNTLRLDCSTR